MSSARRHIQSISVSGAARSSPDGAHRRELEHRATAGAPWPARARTARPRRRTCPAPAAVHGAVAERARRGEPSAPASTASCTIAAIGRDLVGGRPARCAAPRSPIAYAAHRAVRHLHADVDAERRGVERVEVLGERLPAPVHALGERGAGDVLDALHQLDEPLLVTGAHRREPDAAVAGDDGGDAVTRRRLEQRVPGGLAVVVRVDVDEPGRDEQPGGVDRSRPRRRRAPTATPRRSRRPSRRRRRRSAAPVPSTMVPLVILTSYMTAPVLSSTEDELDLGAVHAVHEGVGHVVDAAGHDAELAHAARRTPRRTSGSRAGPARRRGRSGCRTRTRCGGSAWRVTS